MHRSRLIAGILLAAVGAVLGLIGVTLLSHQAVYYVETARWPEFSLLDLVKSPTVKLTLLGGLFPWLSRPDSPRGMHAALTFLLDAVPAAPFFLGAGGLILWRCSDERSPSD
jgi:hypothetical protein